MKKFAFFFVMALFVGGEGLAFSSRDLAESIGRIANALSNSNITDTVSLIDKTNQKLGSVTRLSSGKLDTEPIFTALQALKMGLDTRFTFEQVYNNIENIKTSNILRKLFTLMDCISSLFLNSEIIIDPNSPLMQVIKEIQVLVKWVTHWSKAAPQKPSNLRDSTNFEQMEFWDLFE